GALWWEPEWSLRAVNKTIFDNANRPVAEVFLASDGVTNLVEKWRTTTAYEGDLTKTTPPDGGVATTTVTDADGRTIEARRHNTAAGVGGTYDLTRYEYNAKDQLVKIVGPTGNEWRTTYDIQGRVVETADPDKGVTESEYNDLGDLVKTTDARGEVLAYTYDQLGRKTAVYDDVVSPATKRAEWKYDRLIDFSSLRGQLTETIRYEPPGSTNAYKWQLRTANARYQITGFQHVIPASETGLGGTYIFANGFAEADGSQVMARFPAAGPLVTETLTTVYDPTSGLPIALTSSAEEPVIGEQTYTEYGEPTRTERRIDDGDFVEDVVTYDPATRRVAGTAVRPEHSGKVVDRSYEYTDAGTILEIADTPQLGQADTQCFRRDALTRLTTAWTPKTGITCEPNPTVADLGGPAPYWNSWTYDATGNRLTQVQHTATGNNTQTSAYPAQGASAVRPHAVTSVTRSGPAGAGVDAYSYDATGNTTSRPGVSSAQTLTWNSEGRLASVTDAGATTSNVYDADGSRLIRRDAAGTTLYLPGMELRRESGTTTCTRYITFAGQTIAQRTGNSLADVTWLYADHQGTGQTAIAAETHAVTTRRTTPYGTPRGTNPTWPNKKGFVGGDIDPTGLTHLGAREYDPGQGRFISVDPVFVTEDPRQHHGYQYGANDPVTHSDPTGLKLPSEGKDSAGPPPASNPPPPKKCNWICQGKNKISGAVGATTNWVKENKAEIAGFVVGAVVGVGCAAAIGWTGVGAVACGAIAGAAGAAVTGYMNGERGLDLVTTTIIGAATGAVTSVLGPVAAKAIGGAAKAAAGAITGGGARAATGAASTAASAGAKNVAATAGKATGIKLPTLKTAGTSCTRHSFAAGTAVVMADGTTKPIADVEVGDEVLATDPETGETSPRTVTVEHLNLDNELTDLTVADATGETHLIETTPNHPFWSTTRQAWIGAGDLQPGETLHTLDGTTATITRADTYTDPTYMYDLTVDTTHTYYVMAGRTSVLVHNCGDADLPPEDASEWFFRGVDEQHPGYADALNGTARPRGGHSDWARHNAGDTESEFTSWTSNRSTAERHATKMSGRGVVLMVRRGSRAIIDMEFFGLDKFGESEVLIEGIVQGARHYHHVR
ncbi:polymorphic toxin-type HINT domain-containing protein, partial [Polymorphospora sp. NPDC051019]|uniref:polymorphic toxin-type HINT domain-containing protein n=1 Tax=Polymorphospora sp. NPDC051019 TaxID=3155725 RepID=UPI0034163FE1